MTDPSAAEIRSMVDEAVAEVQSRLAPDPESATDDELAILALLIRIEQQAADLAAANATIAAQRLALATMREALRDLCNVVEDARSVGEMQGENFAMSPWSDLERAAPRYLPLLAQPADTAAALAGAVLEAGDAMAEAFDLALWHVDSGSNERCEGENLIDAYRRARAALRGAGTAEG